MFQSSSSQTFKELSSQQQLVLANQNYETLLKGVETIKDYAIYVLDTKGIVLTWNKGAETTQGYQAKEVIGQPITNFYTLEAIEQQLPKYELDVAKAEGRFENECWRIRKDGTSFWANIVITAIYNEKNEHIGFVEVTRDLTERKLAEEKIKTLEAGIVSVKDYAIFLLDKNGCVSSWNKGAETIKGYQAKEVMGQPLTQFYTPEVLEQHLPQYKLEAAKAEGRFEHECWQIRKDGTSFWADVVITAIYDEKNDHIGFMEVTRDLTERKQAERALAKSERDYRTLASIAPVGIFHCTPEGHLTYANEQACRFMGLSLEEALGTGWFNAIHPEDRDTVVNQWNEALKAGKTFTLEYRFYQPKNDEIIWVINQARPELDEKERVKSYVQTITNINERKMLEAKELQRAVLEKIKEGQQKMLEEAESNHKRLKEFIDTICHEIRNPLNGMMGSAEMLKETIKQLKSLLKEPKILSVETDTYLATTLASLIDVYDSLYQSVQQQKLIVDEVLDASKLEHNKLELKVASFSPKSVILAAVQIFTSQFKHKGIQLEIKLPDKETIVEGDAGRLKQVVINLLSNALKFTIKGTVTVSLTEHYLSENTVELTIQVADTGIGMNKEEMSQLFKRFTQFGHSSSSPPHRDESTLSGTGLGLNISQKLIEMMGGHIEVKSKKDQGTAMSIKLPIPLSATPELQQVFSPEPASIAPIAALANTQWKILIVEDNPINQKVLIHYLKQSGWAYQIAENGLEALRRIEENEFDVILMDIEMPVMGGLEATQQIRQREQQLGRKPVIIVGTSANTQQEHIKIAKEAGMNEYLTKPVHKATLMDLLHGLSSPRTSSTATLPEVALPSPRHNFPAANMPFFQNPAAAEAEVKKLVLKFKNTAKELIAQQYPFSARCENECITLELPPQLLTPHLCKLVLIQFRKTIKQVLQEKIVKANVNHNHLRIIVHTSEEAVTLKTILSEAGFAEAFNQPATNQTETQATPSHAYSS